MLILSPWYPKKIARAIGGWLSPRSTRKSRIKNMRADLPEGTAQAFRIVRLINQACCRPKHGEECLPYSTLRASCSQMVEGTHQDLGNINRKPQFGFKVFRGIRKIDEEWKWWVLHVGTQEDLCWIFRTLRSSHMEDPRTYQFHGKLLLLNHQDEAGTSILRSFWLCEDLGCSGSVIERNERKAKGWTCYEALFSANDTNI